jgi:type I restriction enzyme S subunit
MTGSAGQLRVPSDYFKSIQIPVPPIAEQARIVTRIEELFSELDKSVESLHTAQEQLKVYRQALLKSAFEGKLTATWRLKLGSPHESVNAILDSIRQPARRSTKLAPINPGDTFPIPSSWTFKQLGYFSEIIGGITKGKKYGGQKTIQLPYLRVANVQDGYLDLKQIKTIEALPKDLEKYRLLPGDILYTEGGDRDKLGRGTIWQNEVSDCIHQNHIFRARLKSDAVRVKYIAYYSQAQSAKDYFFKYGKQTTNLASINLTVLSNFPIPIPPAEEQTEIVNMLEGHLSWCDRISSELRSCIRQAEYLRQSILRRAFSGKLVSQNPLDEPTLAFIEPRNAQIPNTNGTHPRVSKTRKKNEHINHSL